MRVAVKIYLSADDRTALQRLATSRRVEVRIAERAKIVLLAADGLQNLLISDRLGVTPRTVGRWRTRYVAQGLSGIMHDAPRPGGPVRVSKAMVDEIVRTTCETKPPNATQWSTRMMGARFGVSHNKIAKIWRAHGLKPHLVRTFKVSNDPQFVEKLEDVVGLYMDPPDRAVVLCVDEKSQIQALDRTQPGLPMKKGRAGTMTHDYLRHGTTTLFSALNTLEGTVIAECMPRHRHQEYLRFLKKIDREVPANLDVHIIVDNYATHKHPVIKRWLKRHPRFHDHFTPTSSSWLNLVERFFGEITQRRIRRGVFHSVKELIKAIMQYVEERNKNPKPFVWTKSARSIIEKVDRAKQQLNNYTTM